MDFRYELYDITSQTFLHRLLLSPSVVLFKDLLFILHQVVFLRLFSMSFPTEKSSFSKLVSSAISIVFGYCICCDLEQRQNTGKCGSEHSRRIQMYLMSSHAAALLPLIKKQLLNCKDIFKPHESVCSFSWTFQGDFLNAEMINSI